MPEKVATLKKQNGQLKSQIAELSSGLKNLKEMLEKRRFEPQILFVDQLLELQTMRWRGVHSFIVILTTTSTVFKQKLSESSSV